MTRRYRRNHHGGVLLLSLVVWFVSASLIAWVLAIGAAGTTVYALSRRGRGPTPRKVFQAVWEPSRAILAWSLRPWSRVSW